MTVVNNPEQFLSIHKQPSSTHDTECEYVSGDVASKSQQQEQFLYEVNQAHLRYPDRPDLVMESLGLTNVKLHALGFLRISEAVHAAEVITAKHRGADNELITDNDWRAKIRFNNIGFHAVRSMTITELSNNTGIPSAWIYRHGKLAILDLIDDVKNKNDTVPPQNEEQTNYMYTPYIDESSLHAWRQKLLPYEGDVLIGSSFDEDDYNLTTDAAVKGQQPHKSDAIYDTSRDKPYEQPYATVTGYQQTLGTKEAHSAALVLPELLIDERTSTSHPDDHNRLFDQDKENADIGIPPIPPVAVLSSLPPPNPDTLVYATMHPNGYWQKRRLRKLHAKSQNKQKMHNKQKVVKEKESKRGLAFIGIGAAAIALIAGGAYVMSKIDDNQREREGNPAKENNLSLTDNSVPVVISDTQTTIDNVMKAIAGSIQEGNGDVNRIRDMPLPSVPVLDSSRDQTNLLESINQLLEGIDLGDWTWTVAHELDPGNEVEIMNRALAAYNNENGTTWQLKPFIDATGKNNIGIFNADGGAVDPDTLPKINKKAITLHAGDLKVDN